MDILPFRSQRFLHYVAEIILRLPNVLFGGWLDGREIGP
jgi:hypothetical protein